MTVNVLISGTVQGVGFRQYVKSNAKSLNITGWVKNLSSGEVQAVFQGSEENIEHMIGICKKGPFLSEVKDMRVDRADQSKKFDKFEIIK